MHILELHVRGPALVRSIGKYATPPGVEERSGVHRAEQHTTTSLKAAT